MMRDNWEPEPSLGFIKFILSVICAASLVTACLGVYQEIRTERVISAVEDALSQLKGKGLHEHAGAALLDMIPGPPDDEKPFSTASRNTQKPIAPPESIWLNGIRFRREGEQYIRTDMPDICGKPDPDLDGGYPMVCLAGH